MSKYQTLKNNIDIKDVLVKLQPKYDGKKNNAVCIFHEDTKPSMLVSSDYNTYKCLACGAKGDVIDMWARHHNISQSMAAQELSDMFSVGLSFTVKDDTLELRSYIDGLEDKHIKYCNTRCITENTVKEFKLGGHGDYLTMPIMDESGNYKFSLRRHIKTKKYIIPEDCKANKYLANVHRHINKTDTIYITESYLDCLLAYQDKFNFAATLGANVSDGQLNVMNKYFNKIVLCMDNDNTGISSAKDMYTRLKTKSPFKNIMFGKFYGKDIGEHLLNNDDIGLLNIVDYLFCHGSDIEEIIEYIRFNPSKIERCKLASSLADKIEVDYKDVLHDINEVL
jgi:DNA primase